MAKRTTGSKIVPQCDGCCLPDFSDGYCTAFDDPEYQHRGGRRCWGRCESIDEMIRRLEGMVSYNKRHGMNTAGEIKKELAGWQETAREIRRIASRRFW